jgi:hypothetical protein
MYKAMMKTKRMPGFGDPIDLSVINTGSCELSGINEVIYKCPN